MSLAARNAGLTVVAAVEKDKNAGKTYTANLIKKTKKTTLYSEDIRKLKPQKLTDKHFSGRAKCDVVLGGPPCQGFSAHRIKGAGVDDPRNDLVLRYFQFVAALKPKVFLMENVPGILWSRHKPFLDAFYKQGKKAGYDVKPWVVLDARDYGVPQRRKRVFILGIRKDFVFKGAWPPPATHGGLDALLQNPRLQPWNTAATVFSTPISPDDANDLHMQHSAKLIEVFKATPKNGGSRSQSGRTLPCHADHNGHTDVYGRIDSRQPGPTMTTACINPSKGRFVHPTKNHGISVRHAARFQTFPDSFVFEGGLTAAGAQIGNAVPVLLGKVLLKEVVKGIRTGKRKKKT